MIQNSIQKVIQKQSKLMKRAPGVLGKLKHTGALAPFQGV